MKHQHENGWTLGMDVFVVRTLNVKTPQLRHDKITKIGRKWITVGEGHNSLRFDADSGWIDGGQYMSPGRVWPSEQEYVESTKAHQAWGRLSDLVRSRQPEGLSAEEIEVMIAKIEGARE